MKYEIFVLCALGTFALAAGATVSQLSQMAQQQPQQQSHTGSYTTVYSAYSDPHAVALAAMDRQGSGQYGYPQQYSQPPPAPYGQQSYPQFKDPGFSMQTGFEGFLVPNPLYSVLPWGVETVLLAIVGIVVAVAIKIGIIFFLMKIVKIGKIFKSDDVDVRSYIPSYFNMNNLSDMASTVFDAIDRFNDVAENDGKKI